MPDFDFSTEELLDQARGNESAMWHACVLYAKEQPGGVDGWASFIGEIFAPSWDAMGSEPSALDFARNAARNFLTIADMRPIDMTGDDARAVLTISGPEQEWLDEMGTNIEDIDRSNEVLMAVIAKRRGLTSSAERSGDTLRFTFARGD